MLYPFFSSRLKLQIANRFENYVQELLKKEFSGCTIITQYRLDSGRIPDFLVECDRDLIVVDAKSKEILSKKDVEQIIDYMLELDADRAKIYVRSFTIVPECVDDYAVLNGVEIDYADW